MRHRIMQRRALIILAALLTVDRVHAGPPQQQRSERGIDANVEAILEWLPADTESLFVAQSAFELRAKEAREEIGDKVTWSSWESNWHQFVMWQFRSVNDGELFKHAIGRRVRLVVSAGRCYRAPKWHGLKRYAGCEIIVFDEPSKSTASELMKAAVASARAKEEMEGQPIAEFGITRRQDEWTLLVANPKPGVLFVATDRVFLGEMLKAMRSPRKSSALPADLPEWKYLNAKADLWAIRHLDRKRARSEDGPPAVGLVCRWKNDGGIPAMTLVHLTEVKDQADAVRDDWILVTDEQRGILTTPKVRQLAPGAIELTHRLGDSTTAAYAFWLFMHRFGPGVI